MTDNNHPITPPPELVREWQIKIEYCGRRADREAMVAKIFQLGADMELEACCEWFQEFYKTESWVKHDLKHFRAARRPKPPSLKAQAFEILDDIDAQLDAVHYNILRRALEQLND